MKGCTDFASIACRVVAVVLAIAVTAVTMRTDRPRRTASHTMLTWQGWLPLDDRRYDGLEGETLLVYQPDHPLMILTQFTYAVRLSCDRRADRV